MFFKNLGFCKKIGLHFCRPDFFSVSPLLTPPKGGEKGSLSLWRGLGRGCYFTTTFLPFWMNTPFWAFTTR